MRASTATRPALRGFLQVFSDPRDRRANFKQDSLARKIMCTFALGNPEGKEKRKSRGGEVEWQHYCHTERAHKNN
eukprot:596007-Alexandrium_andersonii.AAC.1